MKITAIGADISRNDVSCSNTLVENIESDLYKLKALGARDTALTNVTGDDVVISAFVEDDLLESVNEGIVNILKDNAAEFIKNNISKPVVSYIAGRTAPPGKRMGHAGAIIHGSSGTAESKINALTDAGVSVAKMPSEIVDLVRKSI